MKRFLHFLGVLATILMVIWDVAEFLAVPALLVAIGISQSFPWQYYAITLGGYAALFAIAEIVAYIVFKAVDKKYTPFIERKLEKVCNRFSKKN